jgi:hypothetical protein
MQSNVTALERAFQLASSGEYHSVSEIRRRLKLEGYSSHQITGPELQRQLRALLARAEPKPKPLPNRHT